LQWHLKTLSATECQLDRYCIIFFPFCIFESFHLKILTRPVLDRFHDSTRVQTFAALWRYFCRLMALFLLPYGTCFATLCKIFEAQYKSLLHFSRGGVKASLWSACCCQKVWNRITYWVILKVTYWLHTCLLQSFAQFHISCFCFQVYIPLPNSYSWCRKRWLGKYIFDTILFILPLSYRFFMLRVPQVFVKAGLIPLGMLWCSSK